HRAVPGRRAPRFHAVLWVSAMSTILVTFVAGRDCAALITVFLLCWLFDATRSRARFMVPAVLAISGYLGRRCRSGRPARGFGLESESDHSTVFCELQTTRLRP